jgi:hypothetical protein
MVSFAIGYLLVLLATVLYVVRLGREQNRLSDELESLRRELAEPAERASRAA